MTRPTRTTFSPRFPIAGRLAALAWRLCCLRIPVGFRHCTLQITYDAIKKIAVGATKKPRKCPLESQTDGSAVSNSNFFFSGKCVLTLRAENTAETVSAARTSCSSLTSLGAPPRQPGALTAPWPLITVPCPSTPQYLCLFNHLAGQLCRCRPWRQELPQKKLSRKLQCFEIGLRLQRGVGMAPNKLAVVVTLVASLLLLFGNSNTKVSRRVRSSGAWKILARFRVLSSSSVLLVSSGCSGWLPAGSSARPSAAPDHRPGKRYPSCFMTMLLLLRRCVY